MLKQNDTQLIRAKVCAVIDDVWQKLVLGVLVLTCQLCATHRHVLQWLTVFPPSPTNFSRYSKANLTVNVLSADQRCNFVKKKLVL